MVENIREQFSHLCSLGVTETNSESTLNTMVRVYLMSGQTAKFFSAYLDMRKKEIERRSIGTTTVHTAQPSTFYVLF